MNRYLFPVNLHRHEDCSDKAETRRVPFLGDSIEEAEAQMMEWRNEGGGARIIGGKRYYIGIIHFGAVTIQDHALPWSEKENKEKSE